METKITPNILVVDDTPANLLAMESILQEISNISIVKANSGKEALSLVLKNEFALVLLDVQMPEMDGFETAELMRGNNKTKHIPIIFVTALNKDQKYEFKGYSVGAVDYIFKPVDPFILTSKVKVFCELYNQKKELDLAQHQLIETARHAGMAEVAISVLHNIGNILNSLNISVTKVKEQIQHSQVSKLKNVMELFDQNQHRLCDFLTTDEKGTKLLPYLKNLNDHLQKENLEFQDQLNSAMTFIQNIVKVVSAQQSLAKKVGVISSESINDIIAEIIQIKEEEAGKYKIKLLREIDAIPPITIDRHKLSQILLNLISNAIDALKQSTTPNKEIKLQVTLAPDNKSILLAVIDNGIGIPADKMNLIFNFGYTTKANGHGFGLHGSANFAKELGGSLHAKSPGENKGASFELTIPLKH